MSANYEWIPGYFSGDDVFIVGAGPSLTGFDFSRLNNKRKIVVSHVRKFVEPNKDDVLVFLDAQAKAGIGVDFYSVPYKTVTSDRGGLEASGNVAVVRGNSNFSMEPGSGLFSYFSSGHFAISVALVGNSSRIFLMGFDCHTPETGKANFYNTQETKGYIMPSQPGGERTDRYLRMLKGFDQFKACHNIYNLSGDSKIQCFPKMSYEQAGL